MKKLISMAALALAQTALAGGSSVAIAIDFNPQAPAVRMQMTADYVAIPINIHNDSKEPIKRSEEIEKTLRLVAEGVRQHPGLSVRRGLVSLTSVEKSGLKSYASSSDAYGASSAQLYVLGELKGDANIFSVTRQIHKVINALAGGEGTIITLGKTVLGLTEPEQYRGQLLGLLAKSLHSARQSLGMAVSAEVSGLESPVTVMQINDRELALFINYRLKVEAKGS